MPLGARFVPPGRLIQGGRTDGYTAGGVGEQAGGVVGYTAPEGLYVAFKSVNVGCTATFDHTWGNAGGVKSPVPPSGALLTTETGKRPGVSIWPPSRGPVNRRALNALAMFSPPLKSRLTIGLLPPP